MSYHQNKVVASYSQGSWAFFDPSNPSNRVRLDQALIDATHITATRVEGYVRSVHGIDQEVTNHLDSGTRTNLGIAAAHRLGRVGTLHRVRLMPDGAVEREGYA